MKYLPILAIALVLFAGRALAQTTYDDTDSSIVYSRTEVSGDAWTSVTNESPAPDYGASQHYSNGCAMPVQTATSVQGAMAAINFIGTSITVIGEKGTNFGIGAFAIDGGALTTEDSYSATKLNQQALFTASGLANEPHVLTYQVTCNKNAASSGYYQVLDAYTVTGTNNPFANAAQNSKGANNITLGGSGWTCGGDAADISGSQCWDGTAGDSITYTFTGSLAEVFIRPDVGDGYFDVQIDGTTVAHDVSGQYTTADNDMLDAWMAFAKSGLSAGTHTMKLIVDGSAPYPNEAENSGQKNLLQFDVGLSFPATAPPTSTPAATPTPTGQATVCNPVITLPANNSTLTQGNITVGATANCNGTYDHIRWSWGVRGGSGETDFALIPSGSSTATMNASTQAPGAYQAAAAVYLANGSIVTSNGNGGWSPLFFYTLDAVATPTPTATSTPSPNCTEITTSGPTIRDGNGNVWAFNSSFQATENGSVFDNSGANLTEMVYSSGSIAVGWQNSEWWYSTPAGSNFSNETNTAPCSGVPLAATFLDNNTLTPSGAPESHVQISGLTESTIASMTITGTGVAADDWVYPANGTNLVPTIQMDGNGTADVWFQWVAHAPSYVIAVGYADGTSQVSDPEIPDPGQTFNVDRIDLPQIHKSLNSPPDTHSEIRIQGDKATWTFSVPNKSSLN